ncbi:ATP-grasp domain-containing protein [Woeseia oceani]|uniref:ATP-grasp domain-containing protein n=1 Tax=Woeseia oceani TaxID=1548547 RepID=A0A193LKN9_9GAMM|nr:hypothetical protein [Woeseia oceani]ANO53001.1 hypothetical protein BA177_04675 [Woeseia oceani]
MANITRRIGLSLGADICWPICYEALIKELDLDVPHGKDRLQFEVDRVYIEPFNLQQPCQYDVVVDRLTHWYHTSREWIKKSIVMDDLYVFNNPWTLQSMEKHTTYAAMMRLGFPIPPTWMIPPKEYTESADLQATLKQYAKLFDLGAIGDSIGYPQFMKPYDGGAWVGVTAITDRTALQEAYEHSGTRLMHLQQGVPNYDAFVRCIGLGPQWLCVNYNPEAPLHDRYRMDVDFLSTQDENQLANMTMVINAFFGWDFNSCESLRSNGVWHPIDFANACPDSQVTSLHFHFPWLIKANLRWSLFCAATKRKLNTDLNWQAYYKIADKDIPFDEKLAGYVAIAENRFSADEFYEFCDKHLGHLDEVALAFFGTETVRDAIRKKVSALYPEHEIDEFTELFWSRIQSWRQGEGVAA